MCDRIAIIDKGNLVALDTTQKLLDRIEIKKISFKVQKAKNGEFLKLEGVKFHINSDNLITVSYKKNTIILSRRCKNVFHKLIT